MKRIFFILCALYLLVTGYGQDIYTSSYLVPGAPDIIYDADSTENILWLGTENGLQYFNGVEIKPVESIKFPVTAVKAGDKKLLVSVFRIGLYEYDIASGKITLLPLPVNSTCNIAYLGNSTWLIDDRDSKKIFFLNHYALEEIPVKPCIIRKFVRVKKQKLLIFTMEDTLEMDLPTGTLSNYQGKTEAQVSEKIDLGVKINKEIRYGAFYMFCTYGKGLVAIPEKAIHYEAFYKSTSPVSDITCFKKDLYVTFLDKNFRLGMIRNDSIHIMDIKPGELGNYHFTGDQETLFLTAQHTYRVKNKKLSDMLPSTCFKDNFNWNGNILYYTYTEPPGWFFNEKLQPLKFIEDAEQLPGYIKPKKYIAYRDTIYFVTNSRLYRFNGEAQPVMLHEWTEPVVDIEVWKDNLYILSRSSTYTYHNGSFVQAKIHINQQYPNLKFYNTEDKLFILTQKNILEIHPSLLIIYTSPAFKNILFEGLSDFLLHEDTCFITTRHGIFAYKNEKPAPSIVYPFIEPNITQVNYENRILKLSLNASTDIQHLNKYEICLYADDKMIAVDTITHLPDYHKVISNSPTYTIKVNLLTHNGAVEIFSKDIFPLPFFWTRKNLVYLTGLIVLLLLTATLISMLNIRKRKKTEALLEQMHIESKLNLQLMNPHFLFNSINSIQNIIIDGNPIESYNKLNDLSVMLRKIIDNSREGKIRVEEEIDLVCRYIDFENFRFRENIRLVIDKDPAISPSSKIPSMMLQPFIENAVLHGLRQREGSGEIHITLKKIRKNVVNIQIEDNGQGLGSQQNHDHSSSTFILTRKRLAYFSKKYGYPFLLKVTDKQSISQESGTIVELDVPLFPAGT